MNQTIWTTILFDATAGLFVAITIAALLNLCWVRRLPALETLPQ